MSAKFSVLMTISSTRLMVCMKKQYFYEICQQNKKSFHIKRSDLFHIMISHGNYFVDKFMLVGFFSGVMGCALWGFIYLVPLLLSGYDPISIAMARFACFGIGSVFLLYRYQEQLKQLTFRDWFDAFNLAFIGNAVYFVFLSQGIKLSGAPLAGMLMALIPVLVAVITNRKTLDNPIVVPWKKLIVPLGMILLGLVMANLTEFELATEKTSTRDFWIGAGCSTIAMLLWTWFPIRNSQWLTRHPTISPFAWTTAQGFAIFPATVFIYCFVNVDSIIGETPFLGETPLTFIMLMLLAGIICGWGGMALWNYMSARLPVALSGQMIVFETIFSVIYTLIYREEYPSWTLLLGLIILLLGVVLSLKVFQKAIKEYRAQ